MTSLSGNKFITYKISHYFVSLLTSTINEFSTKSAQIPCYTVYCYNYFGVGSGIAPTYPNVFVGKRTLCEFRMGKLLTKLDLCGKLDESCPKLARFVRNFSLLPSSVSLLFKSFCIF